MNTEEAKATLSALANGANPITGEVLPDNSPYNEPKVIRALFMILDQANGSKPKKSIEERRLENTAGGRPRNAGLPWTESLKAELAGKFKSHAQIGELARHFERTRGAIVSELVKQGLIEKDTVDDMRYQSASSDHYSARVS